MKFDFVTLLTFCFKWMWKKYDLISDTTLDYMVLMFFSTIN